MGITTSGRDKVCALIIGEATPAFDSANALLGVGDSTAAFAANQTDLQAVANKISKAMDDGFPTRSGNVMKFRATYGTGEANFAWEEWAIFDGAGVMLSRKVESFGSKSAAQAWQLTVTLELTI